MAHHHPSSEVNSSHSTTTFQLLYQTEEPLLTGKLVWRLKSVPLIDARASIAFCCLLLGTRTGGGSLFPGSAGDDGSTVAGGSAGGDNSETRTHELARRRTSEDITVLPQRCDVGLVVFLAKALAEFDSAFVKEYVDVPLPSSSEEYRDQKGEDESNATPKKKTYETSQSIVNVALQDELNRFSRLWNSSGRDSDFIKRLTKEEDGDCSRRSSPSETGEERRPHRYNPPPLSFLNIAVVCGGPSKAFEARTLRGIQESFSSSYNQQVPLDGTKTTNFATTFFDSRKFWNLGTPQADSSLNDDSSPASHKKTSRKIISHQKYKNNILNRSTHCIHWFYPRETSSECKFFISAGILDRIIIAWSLDDEGAPGTKEEDCPLDALLMDIFSSDFLLNKAPPVQSSSTNHHRLILFIQGVKLMSDEEETYQSIDKVLQLANESVERVRKRLEQQSTGPQPSLDKAVVAFRFSFQQGNVLFGRAPPPGSFRRRHVASPGWACSIEEFSRFQTDENRSKMRPLLWGDFFTIQKFDKGKWTRVKNKLLRSRAEIPEGITIGSKRFSAMIEGEGNPVAIRLASEFGVNRLCVGRRVDNEHSFLEFLSHKHFLYCLNNSGGGAGGGLTTYSERQARLYEWLPIQQVILGNLLSSAGTHVSPASSPSAVPSSFMANVRQGSCGGQALEDLIQNCGFVGLVLSNDVTRLPLAENEAAADATFRSFANFDPDMDLGVNFGRSESTSTTDEHPRFAVLVLKSTPSLWDRYHSEITSLESKLTDRLQLLGLGDDFFKRITEPIFDVTTISHPENNKSGDTDLLLSSCLQQKVQKEQRSCEPEPLSNQLRASSKATALFNGCHTLLRPDHHHGDFWPFVAIEGSIFFVELDLEGSQDSSSLKPPFFLSAKYDALDRQFAAYEKRHTTSGDGVDEDTVMKPCGCHIQEDCWC